MPAGHQRDSNPNRWHEVKLRVYLPHFEAARVEGTTLVIKQTGMADTVLAFPTMLEATQELSALESRSNKFSHYTG